MREIPLHILTIVFLMLTNSLSAQNTSDSENITLNLPPMSMVFIVGPGPSITSVKGNVDNNDKGKGNSNKELNMNLTGVDPNRSYLNYLSVVGSQQSNKITATIANPGVPAKTFLYVQVSKGSAEKGDIGIPTTNSWIPLSNNPQDIVINIGNCYTGNGPTTGHLLKYRWDIKKDEFDQITTAIGQEIMVNYTITSDF